MANDWINFFMSRYGLTTTAIDRILGVALSRGGDYADLYFEYRSSHRLTLDEQVVKSATKVISKGVGVRVIEDDRTGYAYTDEITPESILQAAETARLIARSGSAKLPIGVSVAKAKHNLYSDGVTTSSTDFDRHIAIVNAVDSGARAYDYRIREVHVSLSDSIQYVMIATSEGRLVGDVRPLAQIATQCLAVDGGNVQSGRHGGGGRVGLDFFETDLTPAECGRVAAAQSIVQLDAREPPAGKMEVILGPGSPGTLLHEAVGHGLEADVNRKAMSVFSGLIGQPVASRLCTLVDDGTIPKKRGSLNVDDEGEPTARTVLIENGILRGYLTDYLNARLTRSRRTGNGRRESYKHVPIPRMTNTFLLAGQESEDEILKSVKRGLYAVQLYGGEVDVTNGEFAFSASEAYLIEEGRITAPLKGVTLRGNGPEVLRQISAVGNNLKLDSGVGVCGKAGQGVPVGMGQPTIKIREMTVGGTEV